MTRSAGMLWRERNNAGRLCGVHSGLCRAAMVCRADCMAVRSYARLHSEPETFPRLIVFAEPNGEISALFTNVPECACIITLLCRIIPFVCACSGLWAGAFALEMATRCGNCSKFHAASIQHLASRPARSGSLNLFALFAASSVQPSRV